MALTETSQATRYVIERSRLEGAVAVSGAKNSALRLMAASLLTAERVRLTNYPASLIDAHIQLGMLEALGKRCMIDGDTLTIEEARAPNSQLDWTGRSIRNTLLILGVLVARTGAGAVPLPGGCKIGDRKHDLHIMLLERLGARVVETDDRLIAEAPNGLTGAEIMLPLRSTGATENAILCGALARGRTTLWGPHIRPEIVDLIGMLRTMGARIQVFGQERVEIDGVDGLLGVAHRVIEDNLEALTWMIGAAVTDGDVEIRGFPAQHLVVPLAYLRESGVVCFLGEESVIVRGGRRHPVEIATGPYPGINSDMQPLFAVFAATAQGESRITDLRFPGRFGYAAELAKMGAQLETEGTILKIAGGAPLIGAEVQAVDLRAGAALALAGCVADGATTIANAWQIERGYDVFLAKARGLGMRIETE